MSSAVSFITLLLVSALGAVNGVLDLNKQQIQYVADHLTHRNCLRLIRGLHEKGFWLREQLEESTPPMPRYREDADRPCVIQLTNWCDGPGRDMTFDFLALRLEEIGLKHVAETLSRKVYHETAEELHRFFLDDPFKALIPTKSVMLDKPSLTEKLMPAPDVRDKHEKLFVAVVILATICATFCACVGVCLGCPTLGSHMCRRACPAMCSSCYDIALDNCAQFAKGMNRSANKYLFVAPKGGGGGTFMV